MFVFKSRKPNQLIWRFRCSRFCLVPIMLPYSFTEAHRDADVETSIVLALYDIHEVHKYSIALLR